MCIVLIGTGIYYYHLWQIFDRLLKHIPLADLIKEKNRDINSDSEIILPVSEPSTYTPPKAENNNTLYDKLAVGFNDLDVQEQLEFVNEIFLPPLVRSRSCVWLPNDDYGIAREIINDMKLSFPNVNISCEGCRLDENMRIVVDSPPPDYEPTVMC